MFKTCLYKITGLGYRSFSNIPKLQLLRNLSFSRLSQSSLTEAISFHAIIQRRQSFQLGQFTESPFSLLQVSNLTEVNTCLVDPLLRADSAEGSTDRAMFLDSVLRKRRLKMKKHKLRKRRKRQRALKIRLGKI